MRAADGRSTSYSSPAVRRGLVRYVPRLSLGCEARYVPYSSGLVAPRRPLIWVPSKQAHWGYRAHHSE